MQPVTNL